MECSPFWKVVINLSLQVLHLRSPDHCDAIPHRNVTHFQVCLPHPVLLLLRDTLTAWDPIQSNATPWPHRQHLLLLIAAIKACCCAALCSAGAVGQMCFPLFAICCPVLWVRVLPLGLFIANCAAWSCGQVERSGK